MKAIVVGNGPSLRDHLRAGHFESIGYAEIPTFACNLIDLLYDPDPALGLPGTSWRPTFYVWMEYVGYSRAAQPRTRAETFDRLIDHHLLRTSERCFIAYRFKDVLADRMAERGLGRLSDFGSPSRHLTWLETCALKHGVQFDSHDRPQDWHLPIPCNYGGTMNTLLSLCFMMGYSDVAVIGCDLGITEPTADNDRNHFHPSYHTFLDGEFELADCTLEHVHRIARSNFERVGHRIVNCGIGGLLRAYPRMDLTDWILQP